MFLGSLVCNLRCVAGWFPCSDVEGKQNRVETVLCSPSRCVCCMELMNSSSSASRRVCCMCSVVELREQSRLHGAPHRLRVGVFLRVLHAFWGLLRRFQVLFLLLTVLSRLILSRNVWSLHRHVSNASLLHCMVITVHTTHICHRIHAACMMFVVF